MKIYFATPVRGFFQHLFNEKSLKVLISSKEKSIYEVNSKLQKIIKGIGRLPIFDALGYIKAPKVCGEDCDVYGSFNRFLQTDKPYFIYVENPTALYHYRLARGRSYLGNKKLKKLLQDEKLKALVCMSEACRGSFEKVCGTVTDTCILTHIYPLVPMNNIVSTDYICERVKRTIKLLYIAQGVRFFSKGALEVVSAFKQLRERIPKLELTMVTSFPDIDKSIIDELSKEDGISLYDFKFSYKEMQELYAQHTMLLIPTSDDSFNLTVLEAMKAGLPIIGTRLYAIPEMVKDGENGFLTEPVYWFFDKNNIPNPEVWDNRKKTIYSKHRNERVTQFLMEKVELLNNDRTLLKLMSLNSWYKANSEPFSCDYIVSKWNELFKKLEL